MIARVDWAPMPRMVVGPGVWREAPALVQSMGVERLLLITSGTWPGSVLGQLTRSLEDHRITVVHYNHESSNVRDLDIDRALQVFSDRDCDGLLSLGGGSAHDTAKAVRVLLAAHRESISGAQGRSRTLGLSQIPHIAINTTSGTGAELSGSYVYTDTAIDLRPRKRFVIDELVVPTLAIDDPTLMYTQPPWVVAYSGIDALTHALESYAARPGNWFASRLAFWAAEEIFSVLEYAASNPHDEEPMTRMCVAQAAAGAAFSSAGLGLVHAVSHALSAHFDIHHGLGNAIALPHVLRFNCQAFGDLYDALGNKLELRGVDGSVAGTERLLLRVDALLDTLMFPRTIREASGLEVSINAMHSALQDIIQHVMEDPCLETNAREVHSVDEIEEIIGTVFGLNNGTSGV